MEQSTRQDLHTIRTQVTRTRETTKGTDLHLMRESNRLLILNCVREHGPLSRAEVARATMLSGTTVGTIIDNLLKEKLVSEGTSQRGTNSNGRRIIPIYFNATAGYILGIALGRNHLSLLLSDLAATIVLQDEIPFATGEGPDICLPLLIKHVHTFVEKQQIGWNKIVGIALGMPGPLNARQEKPTSVPGMPVWDGVPVRQILHETLKLPIYLDNNANMGTLGESRFGVGRNIADLLYVKTGTGIGSGLIVNGRIYRGNSGSAGEIGHMTIEPQGPPCACGNHGCLEALVGTKAILRAVQRYSPNISDIEGVITAALAGHTGCQQTLEQAGEYIGIALANLINFCNPAMIVIDGGIMRAGDLLFDAIHRSITARSLRDPLAQTQIVAGTLKGNAIVLGCVATVLDATFGIVSS